MNAYQFDRLASEFGVIAGVTLKAALDSGTYTPEQIAAMCSTRPDVFALRLAFWQSAEAPTGPAVVTSDRIQPGTGEEGA